MTEPSIPGHSPGTMEPATATTEPGARDFDAIYREHFPFVWRNLRRLGVAEAHVEDAAQEVWVVVHRRLKDFEGRSSVRTWLFGIAMRTASDHRRWRRRKDPRDRDDDVDAVASRAPSPEELTERAQAARALDRLLDAIPEERRAVFVLAELEQMSAPEIAQAIGIPLNTVYSRLRVARAEFETAAQRYRSTTEPPR